MRELSLNPTATREWLRNSEELLLRITEGLATTQEQIARSRQAMNTAPTPVRRHHEAERRIVGSAGR